VAATAVIGAGAQVGARSYIGPGCTLAAGAAVGSDCRLQARVTLERNVVLGDRVLVHAGAVLGADGFGFARDGAGWTKVPQLGGVRVGSDVEIGANSTIDRGAIDDTIIEDGVKIDNQVQIGHNVRIGAHTVIAACVGISGSTRIGHLDICDDVAFTGMSMIAHSISKPGIYSGGIPAQDARSWRRLVARLKRLDSFATRLRRVERQGGIGSAATNQQDDNDE
jgi:UDP-3-O-[3-hydroxymyristoyl] glucosamine N-acyltransferase